MTKPILLGSLAAMDGTNEDQAYIDHHEREAEHLEQCDEGEAETLTPAQRASLADEDRLRAQDRRNELGLGG